MVLHAGSSNLAHVPEGAWEGLRELILRVE